MSSSSPAPPTSPTPPPGVAPVLVVGARRTPFRDIYHQFLRLPWAVALGALVVVFLALNAAFAELYLATGGITNAREGSFADAFFFSVQTMGTIGYGSMYPASTAANVLVVAEAVVGLLVTAVATGLVFAKFSQSNARILFSRHVTIAPWDGVPTLMFRLSNERGNQIVEAQLRVTLVRTEKNKEGVTFYKMYDLPLTRDRSPAFTRSWSAMHPILPGSMLHGETPESVKAREVELIISMIGTDDTSLQPVHARHMYADHEIVWGARPCDVLYERQDGQLVLDLTKFHEIEATTPTDDFPYPREAVSPRSERAPLKAAS